MRMILTADWHLRESRPQCRIDDDWVDSQFKVLKQIVKFSEQYDCDVYCVGDMFNASTEFKMVRMVQKIANDLKCNNHKLLFIPGNHDELYHSTQNIDKSAIGLLFGSENIYHIGQYHINDDVSAVNFDEITQDKHIIFKHILCFPRLEDISEYMKDVVCARDLLDEYKNAQWIFTGDYHRNFVYEFKGRKVVNPGCIIKQSSDMIDYQCIVYFVDTEKNEIKELELYEDAKFIDCDYLIQQKEKENRIDDLMERLNKNTMITLDYINNVKNKMEATDLKNEVAEKIRYYISQQ